MKIHLAEVAPKELMDELLDIEIADVLVKSKQSNIEKFIDETEALAESLQVLDCVGLYVLHKHHEEKENEVLVRKYINNRSMYVTMQGFSSDLIPASWMLFKNDKNEGIFLPTEFATDRVAKEQFEKLKSSGFLEKFADLIFSYELEDTIGLTLAWANELEATPDEILVEQTEIKENEAFIANVVNAADSSSFKEDELIPTNWFFTSSVKSCRCRRVGTRCVQYRTFCIRLSPGHSVQRRCTMRRAEHRLTCIG